MYHLPSFELVKCSNDMDKNKVTASSILSTSTYVPLSTSVDLTGTRVTSYVDKVECCDIVKHCISPYLTNYFLVKDGYKKWSEMPDEFNNTTRRVIAKKMSSKKYSTS